VATGTGAGAVDGEDRVEEQTSTEFDALDREGIVLGDLWCWETFGDDEVVGRAEGDGRPRGIAVVAAACQYRNNDSEGESDSAD
jgi:hypothetical protein